jgi:hypothetical protein
VILLSQEMFSYIKDDVIRENCTSDFSELESCIFNNSNKAAVVIAGGLIEAILFYEIYSKDEYRSQIPNFDKRDLTLSFLIQQAKKFGIINDNIIKLTDQIRDYRNAIHPNVYVRRELEINKNIALIAYNLLLEILNIITKHNATPISNYESDVWDIVNKHFGRPPSKSEIFIFKNIISKYGINKGEKIVVRSIKESEGIE